MDSSNQLLKTLPASISSILLPLISFHDLPEGTKIENRIALSVTRSMPALRDSLKVLTESTRLLAVVADLFATETFSVAEEFGLTPYLFFPTNAMVLSLIFHLPKLDETYLCEYRDIPEPIKLPGCFPVHGRDFPSSVQDRNDMAYKRIVHRAKQYRQPAGIIVNSFVDLEPGAFEALMRGEPGLPPIYPVGPVVKTGSRLIEPTDESGCVHWLDNQPSGSVIFVCFGSGGTLSQEQLNEVAFGLEMSGQRFIWVVRIPDEKAANAAYFGFQTRDPLEFLPDGFLDRTRGLGLVVRRWAPQIEVLRHVSTGGFVTHCGWNSTLEGIVNGVPLIAWPLYAEQRMNAVLVADDLKIGIRVKGNENGLVGREEIVEYAKRLIEGEEGKMIRERMRQVKEAASRALSKDGSSANSLAKLVEIWKSKDKKC